MSVYDTARSRVDVLLGYHRQQRPLNELGLGGVPLRCSYSGHGDGHEEHEIPGIWEDMDGPHAEDPKATVDDWIAFWFQCALEEAVHEMLEHFRVDGQVHLDPHGAHEQTIRNHAAHLSHNLLRLRSPNPKEPPWPAT